MSDDKRQKCCRLCLAPDSECISILNSYAADKEPLTTKIYNCVHIKINSTDRLSLRICHACISYLNSWQSFKNRCVASQNKQQIWLDSKQHQHPQDTTGPQHQTESEDVPDQAGLTSSILDGITSLKKRKSLTVYVSPKQHYQQEKQPIDIEKEIIKPFKPKRKYTRHLKTPMPFPMLQSVLPTPSKIVKPRKRKSQNLLRDILLEHAALPIPLPKPTLIESPLPQHAELTATVTSALMPESLLKPEMLQLHNIPLPPLPNITTFQPTLASSPPLTVSSTTSSSTAAIITMTTATTTVTTTTAVTTTTTITTTAVHTITTSTVSISSAVAPTICTTPTTVQSSAQQLRLFRRYSSSSYNPLPAVQIKEEPYDSDEAASNRQQQQHDECDDMVDPTLFLERTEEEGDEPLDGSVYGYGNQSGIPVPIPASATIDPVKEASCRACNLKFSTRANARRHERTLHPNLFELSTSTPNNTPITKPTAAFAAVLASQRNTSNIAAAAEQASSTSVLSAQKYRQEVFNAFKKSETGGYDYDSPEKYQHLLTDEKIVFLQQNEEFLQQYQTMTCRCCNKFYSTYKNFMAHMRKKYATLPRNLCFNCLKLNDSKALFISHLKRRNCINLYKVLHALMAKNPDFAAAVKATAASVPEKLRAKDLLVNKMYECKLCPKQFRLKLEFRTHVYDEHSDAQQKEAALNACSFCALEIDDPAERKRHYNNMECIVTLRCITCEAKFDNHQKFIDHVYEKHLSDIGDIGSQQQLMLQQTSSADNSPGKKNCGGGASSADESRSSHSTAAPTQHKSQYFSRMPQACPICGQQYNNYNNVLRHMESKHPDQLPQTYKCVRCGTGYPRLSNLREHMVTVHSGDKTRHTGFEYIVNADAVKTNESGSSNAYTGRYDYVMKDLMSITNGGTAVDDDDDADDEQAPKKLRLDGNSSASTNQFSSLKECPICSAVFSNNIGLSNHMRSHTAAAQNAQAAAIAAARVKTPNSLTITPAGGNKSKASSASNSQVVTAQQQAAFRRSLEQAADRRFRRMRCRICQRRFSSKKSYRFHMLNDHQIRNVQFIKCKLCDAEFAYEKGLKVHMFKIHNMYLRDEMIVKQFECDICSIVYRNETQLLQHKRTAHGNEEAAGRDNEEAGGETNSGGADQQSGLSTPVSVAAETSSVGNSGPLYWYQCKYCPSNFNTNKKLAIHINSHDEFDSNDYSCKDCGNVYSGRKSLWVHRYKKHPQIAEPSECVLCKKVFFDSQMLENHIPTCNRKPITATGALAESTPVYRHKTGDDEEDDNSNEVDDEAKASGGRAMGDISKIRIPEVACTICGQRFTDQDLFSKHIQMHEQELYTDNPLASMFDTGPADPNQFYLDCVNDMGEYACDLCSKTFTQMTALKVHRKWHFRGDSKQNQIEGDATSSSQPTTQISHQRLLGLQAVGLMPNSVSKSQKRKRELKCEYCPSTFISNNNLRRHMYELHKDEVTNLPQPPKIKIDEPLHCRRCDMEFQTKRDWIDHKVSDARVTKPFGPFQWGCDLCGAYVSRKEKLINHIQNHLKEDVIVPVELLKKQQQQQQQQQQHQDQQTDSRSLLKTKQHNANNLQSITENEETRLKESDEEDESDDNEGDEDGYEQADGNKGMQNGEIEDEENGDGEGDGDAEVDDEDEDEDSDEGDGDGDCDGDGEGEVDAEDDDDDDEEVEDGRSSNSDGDESAAEGADTARNSDKIVPPLTIRRNIAMANHDVDESMDEDEDAPDGMVDADDIIEEIEDDDMEYEIDEDNETRSSAEEEHVAARRFACDLCQVFFDSQLELQKHVKMHFLNGPGSVSLTEIKSKSMSKSSNNSNGGDVVTVSTS